LITTGLGLKSTVPRDAPSITALFDADESDVPIVSVVPQPVNEAAINTDRMRFVFRGSVFITLFKPPGLFFGNRFSFYVWIPYGRGNSRFQAARDNP